MGLDLTGLGSVFDFGKAIIDRVIPDPTAKAAAAEKLIELQQQGDLARMANETQLAQMQVDVNRVEAANGSLFVSGARPFILWICGFAFLYATLTEPLARFVATVMFHYTGDFPKIDTTITMQALFGMLGLGGLRTYEKTKGVASTEIRKD